MDDIRRFCSLIEVMKCLFIPYIDLEKCVICAIPHAVIDLREIACVGEEIEIEKLYLGMAGDKGIQEIRADKSSSSSYEKKKKKKKKIFYGSFAWLYGVVLRSAVIFSECRHHSGYRPGLHSSETHISRSDR